MKKNTVRKMAQRAFPITGMACQECGTVGRLQRHHPDMEKPLEVNILCQGCHTQRHLDNGSWGKGPSPPRECVVCKEMFKPRRSNSRTCGERECISELGRRYAEKRWKPQTELIV